MDPTGVAHHAHSLRQTLVQMTSHIEALSNTRSKKHARKLEPDPDSDSSDGEDGEDGEDGVPVATDAAASPSLLFPNPSTDINTPSSVSDITKLKAERLDPKLVGMSVGLKNLYSGKEVSFSPNGKIDISKTLMNVTG